MLRYFEREFHEMATVMETPAGIEVAVESGEDVVYTVEIAREFLESHTPAEIERAFRNWNVAGEVRRLEGMPVSVSDGGVRLSSSN